MRRLLVSLALLVGLVVLADFGAAAYAEYRVSRELRTELSLSADPDVRIDGFPFLTQAAAGDYRSVDVRAVGVAVPDFGDVTVEATLRGVHLPPSQVVSGSVTDVTADSVEGRVRIGATELGAKIGVPDLVVSTPPRPAGSPEDAPQTQVVLTGTVSLLGVSEKLSVDAGLTLRDGSVVVTANGLDLGADSGTSSLAESVVDALLSRLSVTIDPSTIPFGVVPTSVRAEGAEIVVEGTATDVVIVGPASR